MKLNINYILILILLVLIINRILIKKERFTIFYDIPQHMYTSNNYYNNPNCTIDKSCIINPDDNNLFPKDLSDLANKSFNNCTNFQQPVIKLCNKNPCNNINKNCNNENMYPIITPKIQNNTLTKGQCAICKIPVNETKEHFTNCCKQGYNNNCVQLCRGCKTGTCDKGWCFSNKCPVRSHCLFK